MAVPDYRKETIHVGDLKLGMFVSELDRPWLDSPFMMQGFLLEEDEQIQQLRSLCKTVIIDRTLSSSEHRVEIPKENVAIVRDGTITTRKQAVSQRPIKSNSQKVSFFDILRELNNSKDQPGKVPSAQTELARRDRLERETSVSPSSKQQTHTQETAGTINDAYQNTDHHQHLSIGNQLKHDMSSVLGKVKGWLPGTKKLKLFGGSSTDTDSPDDAMNSASGYSITIFEDSVPVEEEMAVIYPVFEKTQIATREIFEAIASENKIDLMQVNQTLDSMVESIERNPDALMWLAKLKQRDDYAYNHALNVSINLMALAHFMALPKAQIKDLGLAGLLQDIGKVKIPTKLLHKEAQLSPAEFIEMKTHVKHGLDILRETENMSQNVLNIVANHHERIDGTGYPSKLELKQISLAAQMAGIMDTYCALTSNKPYAKGIFNQQALEEIYASRDKEFSGVLVNQLIQFFGIYPVSSLVELNSGEVAVVIQQNRVRRLQPRVVILLASDKTRNQYPVTLDLINSPPSPSGEPYKITRGLPPDSYGLNPADFYL